ncbi:hypothetical protein [Steroidobacter agaridevorans]|uniref:hypothetical protein n=1 Tax=Steroidobacter agaridevorans TaxID=2695856 RepID=UPI0013251053|nr:hypothetical protein [Steroidobacter agaridevorans]GFE87780.1 hypothetical protein GCM10011488_27340 [Steroidobacter agaridevorans]
MAARMETLLRYFRCALLCVSVLVPAISMAQIEIDPGPEPTEQGAALTELIGQTLEMHPEWSTLDVRVTIGPAALRRALNRGDGKPVIASYLTSTDFRRIIDVAGRTIRVTAVFSNPDPQDQFTLARAVLGENALIGVFDTPSANALLRPPIHDTIRALKFRTGDDIDGVLRQAGSLNAILVLPDGVLTRDNINHAVRTLYGRRVVLIGHSEMLSRVGSLASVYISPENIAAAVADVVSQYAATQELMAPVFVEEVDVAVNPRLARSLNLTLPSTSILVRTVREGRRRR